MTRLINEMDEALLAADGGRLKQLRQSLKNKIEILSKLDEELLVSSRFGNGKIYLHSDVIFWA